MIRKFEGFVSNIKDDNRSVVSDDVLDELKKDALSSGLNIENAGISVWACKEGNDVTEWRYDGEYLYYKDEYRKYLK